MELATSDLIRRAFEQAVVRVRDDEGRTVGTGFLVADDLVCTCAHVVASAVGADARSSAIPSGDIIVDFPLAGEEFITSAQVVEWTPIGQDETGDIAVLQVAATPGGARPAPLAPEGGDWNETVRLLGFPSQFEDGVWKSGRLQGRQATGWVQIEISGVAAGFSGGAVWGDTANGVIGIAVGRQGSDIAYMIPLRSALSKDVLRRQPCPYRGLEPFREQDASQFHGRAEEAARLAERVAHRQIVVVTGRSGCGKSSLVRAALFPVLRAEGAILFELPRMVSEDVELPTGDDPVVVFADQFEEVEPARARELFVQLRKWAEEAPPRAGRPPHRRVVLTLRTAAIDEIFTAQDAELLDKGGVQVLPMGPSDLLTAVVAPAKPRRLEDGLPERIVRDARDAPGQLPLLQFALTRLWDRGLTHAAYEAIGRVTGALADYADDIYEHRLRTAGDQAVARKLLVRLARPSGSSFTLAPARLADLDPELRAMAGELSTHRLVVIEHNEVVSLAHEALIHEWPRLHDWLVADHEFLEWRHRLRVNMDLWREKPDDIGRLLRGGPLTDAELQAATRPDELSTEERHYIRISRRSARRGTRLRRMAVAVIALLAVVTSTLAVVYVKRSDELAENLRLQAGSLLAAESTQLLDSNLLSALQFAQAAHRLNPSGSDTQSAMMTQVAKYSQVRSLRAARWRGQIIQTAVSSDGAVVALADEAGKITVWHGLNGAGEPESWEVTTSPRLHHMRISEDGSTLAIVSEYGEINIWRIADRSGPTRLREPGASTGPASTRAKTSQFSPDGSRFVIALELTEDRQENKQPDLIEAYDTRAAKAIPTSITPEGVQNTSVGRVDPSGQVWLREYGEPGERRNVVRELSGGLVRELPQGSITPRGVITNCENERRLTVFDGTNGSHRFTRTLPRCPELEGILDDTMNFALVTNGSKNDTLQLVTVVELISGDEFQMQWPYRADDHHVVGGGATIITKKGSGEVVAHTITSSGIAESQPLRPKANVMAFSTTTFGNEPSSLSLSPGVGIGQLDSALSPDGMLLAGRIAPLNGQPELALWKLHSQEELKRVPMKLDILSNLTFTSDQKHLLAIDADKAILVLSVPEMVIERKIIPPDSTETELGWDTSILALGDDVVALHAGTISRWKIASGDRVGTATPLLRDAPRRIYHTGKRTQMALRPGHGGQVYVATSSGVLLFDLNQGKIIREHAPIEDQLQEVLVDPSTSRVAIQTANNLLWTWDPDDDILTKQTLPTLYLMREFTPDGLVVFENDDRLDLWDPQRQRTVGTLDLPGSHFAYFMAGSSLISPTNDGLVTINLDRNTWPGLLCKLNDRDYTPAERAFATSILVQLSPPCR